MTMTDALPGFFLGAAAVMEFSDQPFRPENGTTMCPFYHAFFFEDVKV